MGKTIQELGREFLLPEYQNKYDSLEKIAFELHKLNEKELESMVIKKMAGIKLLINYINEQRTY